MSNVNVLLPRLFPHFILSASLGLCLGRATVSPAAIIGTNVPAEPLTAERIATLPARQQTVWKECLDRSARQMEADLAFFQAEMREHGV